MSYKPYVTGDNQKKTNSGTSYESGGNAGTQPSNNFYGSPNIPMESRYVNSYGGGDSTTSGLAKSYNPYHALTVNTSSSTPYSPYDVSSPTKASGAANDYNPYENIPKATPSTTIPATTPYSAVPASLIIPPATNSTPLDSSKVLDAPAPSHQTFSGNPPGNPTIKHQSSDAMAATSYPMNPVSSSRPGVSAMNSMIYQGGPTNGLVSEGNPTKCHKIDFEIKGHEMQLVEIELDPHETVIGEAGGMMFMEDGIKFEAKFGDGSTPNQGFWSNLLAAGGRLLTGESLFVTHFTNEGQKKSRVAFAAPYPGNILPLNLAHLGGAITCQRDAFLCAALGTKVSMTFNKKIGSGLFGGEGFILQKIEGDGMCFIHAGGTIIKRELRNERIRLDTGCLVAFTPGIDFEIQFSPGLKTALFGGEGLFLAVLKGTGIVYMQSLPFGRMADRIIQAAQSPGSRLLFDLIRIDEDQCSIYIPNGKPEGS
ncbi:TIGR00266 family protein [Nitzschia inconspicua]|uniref:TIGR00266 family protein n=1 Tax=Nitzschia inconspicua TaxID=303405 RepID=A0A9K3KI17_9STRA|nr:TIGR00266 family protein [Nitzschia inconspicua]